MPQQNIFEWYAGSGWLVLSGGGSSESDDVSSINARMLGHTLSQGPIVYLWAAGDLERADREMEALRDLGARTGYLIDVLTEQDDEVLNALSEAGVIILGDGPRVEVLGDALGGVVLTGMRAAFSRGATIYAVGDSAGLLGAHALLHGGAISGVAWLRDAAILAGYDGSESDLLRTQVQRTRARYGLGLGRGAALAFGPGGEIEVWGNRAITVFLGEQYARQTDL